MKMENVMKKVMLFIASMLFAVSASAATVNFSTGVNFISAFSDGSEITFDVAPIAVPQSAVFVVAFNPDEAPFATAGLYADGALIDSAAGTPSPGASSLSFIASLVSGVSYSIKSLSDAGTFVSATVNAVPVPAALFLFAPALLGFFGLRRKATV